MPNWCANKLTITGLPEVIDELETKLSSPYVVNDKPYGGALLLWNIVAPTDLEAYAGNKGVISARKAEHPAFKYDQESLDRLAVEILEGFKTGDDWYNWNVRNWGTKWELESAYVSYRDATTITYNFVSAWAHPYEAITKLFEDNAGRISGEFAYLEEGVGFGGEVIFHNDGTYTALEVEDRKFHNLRIATFGECYLCEQNECEG